MRFNITNELIIEGFSTPTKIALELNEFVLAKALSRQNSIICKTGLSYVLDIPIDQYPAKFFSIKDGTLFYGLTWIGSLDSSQKDVYFRNDALKIISTYISPFTLSCLDDVIFSVGSSGKPPLSKPNKNNRKITLANSTIFSKQDEAAKEVEAKETTGITYNL